MLELSASAVTSWAAHHRVFVTYPRRPSPSGRLPTPAQALALAETGRWVLRENRIAFDAAAAGLLGLAVRVLPLADWLATLDPGDAAALRAGFDNAGAPLARLLHGSAAPLLLRGRADQHGWQGVLIALPAETAASVVTPPGLSARDEFVAGISHELRTPLNAIVGFTRLARAERPDTAVRQHLAQVEQAAQLMLRVVNDLLDLARLEAGRLEIDPELPLDLPALTGRVLGLASALRQDKPIRLYLSLDRAIPARLRGDAFRLEQVLVNLVGNALKFTDRGMVVIGAKLRARTADQVTLRLSVSDTGVGIALERLDRIGRAFERGPGSAGGTGLGLAVVRRLLELHGTRLKVASVAGGGTICWFDITLPVDADDGPVLPDTVVFSADRRLVDTVAALWRMQRRALRPPAEADAARHWVVDLAAPDAAARIAQAQRSGRTLHRVTADPLPAGRSGIDDGTVTLPLLAAAAFGPPRDDTIAADPQIAGRRLLVVEDNPMNQQVLAGLLRHLGAEPVLCADTAGALAQLAAGPFDAALLDLQLGAGEHGFDLARAMRALPTGESLPIVFLSAHLDAADRITAGTLGALACLPKPYDAEALQLLLRPLPRRGVAAAAPAPLALAGAPLRALFAGVWPAQRAALDAAADPAALRGAVHALRGSLAVLGERHAVALAREVEEGLAAGRDATSLPLDALRAAADALANG